MLCPYCRSSEISVIDSRDVDNSAIRRRRVCEECRKRFTTYERIEAFNFIVIKSDGKREPFDVNKILVGLIKACEKRPVSREQMDRMVERITAKIHNSGSKEIKSSKIGDLVIRELLKADPVAYIRFASVYKQFGSPAEFIKAVSVLRKYKGK